MAAGAALVVAAAAWRVHGLGRADIWLDEANSWWVAHLSWSGLLANLRASPVGPLYIAALKVWMAAAGDSAAALRTPSLIAGLLVIPATFALGVRTVSRRAAWLGTLLVALSPLQLYFSQEARMYACVAALALWTVIAYAGWRDAVSAARAGRAALAAFAVASTLLALTNLTSLPLVAALHVDAAATLREWAARHPVRARRARRAWMLANLPLAGCLLVLLASLRVGPAAASQDWRPALGVLGALRELGGYPIAVARGLYAYPDVVARAGTDLIRHPGMDTMVRAVKAVVGQPLLLAVMVLLLAASLRGSWRSRRRVLVLACLVPLGVDAVVAAWRSLDLARYALFASPPLLLLAADGLVRLPRADRVAALVVVGWSMAAGLADYSAVGTRDSDYRPVARLLAARSARGEVLVTPPAAREPLAYYLRRDRAVSLRAVGTGGALAAWLRAAPRSPTWVVIDYRSPLHELTPRALQAELGARLVDDRFAGDLDAAPRVLLAAPRLGEARPVTAGGP